MYETHHSPYDVASIMHYPSYADAKDLTACFQGDVTKCVLTNLDIVGREYVIHLATTPTRYDARAIQVLYPWKNT